MELHRCAKAICADVTVRTSLSSGFFCQASQGLPRYRDLKKKIPANIDNVAPVGCDSKTNQLTQQ